MTVPSRFFAALAFAGFASVASAQSVPSVLPGNFTSIGCFTDVAATRTLSAASTNASNMTVEFCIGFCSSLNFIFAGVEFGNCDSTIQVPGVAANLADCDMACDGNAAELCGGPNRLNIFSSGGPSPVIVQSTENGEWTYAGCFTDSVSARTLVNPVAVPIGVTAESCTAACQSFNGGFQFAGIEFGQECWCDNAIHTSQHVSDNDCRQVCDANHEEYCGNADRIAVYQFSASGAPPQHQQCTTTDLGTASFSLQASFNVPPVSGPSTVPLKVVVAQLVGFTEWTVLSACPNCCSEWPTFQLQNSVIFPRSSVTPTQIMSSTGPTDGESPNFVASNPSFPGVQSYCTTPNPVVGSPPLLAFGGEFNAFSLCTNTSANNRLDVVFSPVTGHPHYSLSQCSPVTIQVITSN